MNRHAESSLSGRLRIFAALAMALLFVATGLPAAAQQVTIEDGTLSTTQGSAIRDVTLRQLLDTHIPTSNAHSTLVVLTECYGGDTANNLTSRSNTAVLSATSPGQLAYYGGYDNDAASALKPGSGRTSDDVHKAGVAGKHPSENPTKSGSAVSLESTSQSGNIQSRHILVFAGQPDSSPGRDNDQRDKIENNFQGESNTTVTTVGGTGSGGWDYAGSQQGLTNALKSISSNMGPNEQFILFVTDHGDLHSTVIDLEVPALDTLPLSLFLRNDLVAQMQDTTTNDDGTGISLYIEDDNFNTELVGGEFLFLTLEGSSTVYDDTDITHQDLNGDGEISGEGEGYWLTYAIPESELLAAGSPGVDPDQNEGINIGFTIHNARPVEQDLLVDRCQVDSGPIPKLEGGSFNPQVGLGPNPPSPGTLTDSTANLPALQAQVVSDVGLDVLFFRGEIVHPGGANFTPPAQGTYTANFYADANENGQVDAGESLLGSDTFSTQLPAIQADSNAQIPGGQVVSILVALTPADDGASETDTAWLALGGFAALGIMLPLSVPLLRRKGGIWIAAGTLALVMALMIAVPACAPGTGGEPNGGDDHDGQETFQVRLTEITATNADTGATETFDGLPVTGPTITAE